MQSCMTNCVITYVDNLIHTCRWRMSYFSWSTFILALWRVAAGTLKTSTSSRSQLLQEFNINLINLSNIWWQFTTYALTVLILDNISFSNAITSTPGVLSCWKHCWISWIVLLVIWYKVSMLIYLKNNILFEVLLKLSCQCCSRYEKKFTFWPPKNNSAAIVYNLKFRYSENLSLIQQSVDRLLVGRAFGLQLIVLSLHLEYFLDELKLRLGGILRIHCIDKFVFFGVGWWWWWDASCDSLDDDRWRLSFNSNTFRIAFPLHSHIVDVRECAWVLQHNILYTFTVNRLSNFKHFLLFWAWLVRDILWFWHFWFADVLWRWW